MRGPEAHVYILKRRGSDMFYIGSTGRPDRQFGSHPERFPDFELWGRVRVDPRKRSQMEGRMIRQAQAAGWKLINQHVPPEYGPDDEVDTGWLILAIRRGYWASNRSWLDRRPRLV